MTKLVFCMDCGKCLGEYREYVVKDHLKEFPNHIHFLTKNMIDPLILSEPDIWFVKHKNRFTRIFQQPKSNTEKKTDNETEPEFMPRNWNF